jgi:hypothetical protein
MEPEIPLLGKHVRTNNTGAVFVMWFAPSLLLGSSQRANGLAG